ncbi:MAG: ABC transporter substrate-binding protein [Anaerolineaceae bacterium]
MKIYIGLDDTDNHESRGTGHLARFIADSLKDNFELEGVVRHQLFFDPRVPYTSHNSSASILIDSQGYYSLDKLFDRVRSIMENDFQIGSDPGLCITDHVPEEVIAFGKKVKSEFIYQVEALNLAKKHNIRLAGLGGTCDGIIGSLAAVGLSAYGEDGRYVQVGKLRELSGLQSFEVLRKAGIAEIRTMDGKIVTSGETIADKLRPARREKKPILFVQMINDQWEAIKLD